MRVLPEPCNKKPTVCGALDSGFLTYAHKNLGSCLPPATLVSGEDRFLFSIQGLGPTSQALGWGWSPLNPEPSNFSRVGFGSVSVRACDELGITVVIGYRALADVGPS